MVGGAGYPGAGPQLVDDDVLFCVRDAGCSHLYRVAADGGAEPKLVLGGADRVISGLSVAGDRAAVVAATATSFGEVLTVDLATGAETVLTRHGDSLGEIDWFARQPREFQISDGTGSGWLIQDPHAPLPRPLLLDVHGGPHNAWTRWPTRCTYQQVLAARGWGVLR